MKKMIEVNRLIVVFLIVFAYAPVAQGQAMIALLFGNKIKNDKISLGIYIGMQASTLTNTDDGNVLPGFAFGAYTNVKLKGKFMLSNYFIFKSPRGVRKIPLQYQLTDGAEYPEGSEIDRHLTYMELSPLIRYSITPALSVAIGPQLGIRTLAKDIYKKTLENDGKSSVQYKIPDKLSRFDVDFAADVQYALMKGEGLRFNLRFSQGVTNVYKSDVPLHASNQYLQLGLGIPIGGKKK